MITDLQASDLSTLSNDELFAAIEAFCKTQPVEGWRHDFTEVWEDSAIQKTAAFANTFGGILIVGVKKGKRDTKCGFIGVESVGEYKTSIASSIATNISPTPAYSIFECHTPSDPGRRYCVVRIQPSKKLHLITKKSIPNPVYVRNEDEAKPADAARLRTLIDREREAPTLSQEIRQQAEWLRESLGVRKQYDDIMTARWFLSAGRGSSTFLRLVAVPTENVRLELEVAKEQQFQTLVRSLYPRIPKTTDRVALEAEFRGADFYEYIWFHIAISYEARWRMAATGGIGAVSQICDPHVDNAWSVVDLAERVVLFCKLVRQWWEKNNYFGEGLVLAQLNLDTLELRRAPGYGNFPPGMRFWQHEWPDWFVSAHAIEPALSQISAAHAEVTVNYFSLSTGLLRSAMLLLNALLRGLGHGVVWDKLEESIHHLVDS